MKKKDGKSSTNKSYHFSLLELVIVIAVVILISSVVTFDFHRSISRYRFEGNVKKVINLLKFSQEIALTHQVDLVMRFEQRENELICILQSDEKAGFFYRETKKRFCFKDLRLCYEKEEISECSLKFFANGYFSIPLHLTITDSQKKFSKTLDRSSL